MKSLKHIAAAALAAAALTSAAASAAVINPGPAIVGNGNGSVSAITITGAPGNDNVISAGNPNIQINGKNFTAVGPIDIVFSTTDTASISEYLIAEGVTNSTGTPWTDYVIELGFGSGAGFVPSPAGDGLDFDFPTFDPIPTAGAGTFGTIFLGQDQFTFTGGAGVPSGNALALTFGIDVPDGLPGNTFTLRQTPVPEPATFGLLALGGGAALLGRRRRPHVRPAR